MTTTSEDHQSAVDDEAPRGPARVQVADDLMRPWRLATLPPTRLSASRSLVNKMLRERWKIELVRLEIDERGNGEALYRIDARGFEFEFMVFSFEPVMEGRTGRIIGTKWDMMGALVEGRTTPADFAHTLAEFPKLYAGRATPGTLIWCRSNRSMRAFDAVIENLVRGEQPDIGVLASIGYLMRNTGLDGNGTFGTRSFLALESYHPLRVPYHAQMLAAYMMREFSYDLVEHLARCRNPNAAALAPEVRSYMAIGNGSALGLVFFANSHPWLLERWLGARLDTLALAKQIRLGSAYPKLSELLVRAQSYFTEDRFNYQAFAAPAVIASDLKAAHAVTASAVAAGGDDYTLGDLCQTLGTDISIDALEVVHALLIELVPDVADATVEHLATGELFVRDPAATVGELRQLIEDEYQWALQIDMDASSSRHYVWYKSVDAEEPRRGPRDEVSEGRNWALDLPSHVQRIRALLHATEPTVPVGRFLVEHPEERWWVQRIQALRGQYLHSPHMNMLAADLKPSYVVRLINSAFHGLDKTLDGFGMDRHTNRGVVGLLFHGAPPRDGLLNAPDAHVWIYPPEPKL